MPKITNILKKQNKKSLADKRTYYLRPTFTFKGKHHSEEAQPYFENDPDHPNEKRYFDIIITIDEKGYKNKDINVLCDAKQEELKKLEFEEEIQTALFALSEREQTVRE